MSSTNGTSRDSHPHHPSDYLPSTFTNYNRDDVKPSDSIDVIANQLEGRYATDEDEIHSLFSNEASVPGSLASDSSQAKREEYVGNPTIIQCPSAYLYMSGGTNSDSRDDHSIDLQLLIREHPNIMATTTRDAHFEASDTSASPRDSKRIESTEEKSVDMSLNEFRWRPDHAFRCACCWQTPIYGRLGNFEQGVIVAQTQVVDFEDTEPALENYSPMHRWQLETPNEQPWAGIGEVAKSPDDIAHSTGFGSP